MSRQTIIEWTCNRCGHTEQTTESASPQGWAAVAITSPGGAAAATPTTTVHVCRPCGDAVRAALETLPTSESRG